MPENPFLLKLACLYEVSPWNWVVVVVAVVVEEAKTAAAELLKYLFIYVCSSPRPFEADIQEVDMYLV